MNHAEWDPKPPERVRQSSRGCAEMKSPSLQTRRVAECELSHQVHSPELAVERLVSVLIIVPSASAEQAELSGRIQANPPSIQRGRGFRIMLSCNFFRLPLPIFTQHQWSSPQDNSRDEALSQCSSRGRNSQECKAKDSPRSQSNRSPDRLSIVPGDAVDVHIKPCPSPSPRANVPCWGTREACWSCSLPKCGSDSRTTGCVACWLSILRSTSCSRTSVQPLFMEPTPLSFTWWPSSVGR